MPLDQASKDLLLGFLGYGPAHPRFVFIAGEEGLDGDALVNLNARVEHFDFPRQDKNAGLPHLAHAYALANDQAAAQAVLKALVPGSVPVWKFAAMMTAALRAGDEVHEDGPWREHWPVEYEALGTAGGDTLFADMYPLPKKGLSTWPAGYIPEFGFGNFKQYYAGVWPVQGESPRQQAVASIVGAGPLPHPQFVIQCCRGAGNEFWDRFAGILDLAPSTRPGDGTPREWHVILHNRIEVALTAGGTRVARTGFPWSQHAPSSITDIHVPIIANAMNTLTPAG